MNIEDIIKTRRVYSFSNGAFLWLCRREGLMAVYFYGQYLRAWWGILVSDSHYAAAAGEGYRAGVKKAKELFLGRE